MIWHKQNYDGRQAKIINIQQSIQQNLLNQFTLEIRNKLTLKRNSYSALSGVKFVFVQWLKTMKTRKKSLKHCKIKYLKILLEL